MLPDSLITAFENIHFLRPAWLLLFAPVLLLVLVTRRLVDFQPWQHHIAPQLLQAMMIRHGGSSGRSPFFYAALFGVTWITALAGPSWERLDNPGAASHAPLVIALALDESMLEHDVEPGWSEPDRLVPGRLELARVKISDLLEQRQGSATALVAYAGSAHTVIPLSEDHSVLKLYLQELHPDVMPVDGVDLRQAYTKAKSLLDGRGGRVLFVGSAQAGEQWPLIRSERDPQPLYWQLSVEQPLPGAQPVTVDSRDIHSLASLVNRGVFMEESDSDHQQWQDGGYYLVIVIMLLALIFFRRGMVLQ